jgi:hypothetical protein
VKPCTNAKDLRCHGLSNLIGQGGRIRIDNLAYACDRCRCTGRHLRTVTRNEHMNLCAARLRPQGHCSGDCIRRNGAELIVAMLCHY